MSKNKKSKAWSRYEKDIAISLLEDNLMYRDISKALRAKGFDRSAEAVRKFVKRIKNNVEYVAPDKSDHYVDVDMELEHSSALMMLEDKREDMFNIVNERYHKIGNPSGKLHKIVTISDLHIPWVNDNVVADMVSEHNDAEILVINGDFLDQFSVSKWPKSKNVLLRHEYEIGIEYIKQFSKIFKKVVLTRGNHDNRLHSYFSSNLDPGVSFMVHPDPLERLANGYGFNGYGELVKIHNFNNVHYAGGLSAWYAKIGNCLFVHPSKYSKIPMRTAQFAAEFFWEKEDFDAIICAHCFDEDTEILTHDGWKTIDTIQDWHKPATLNTNTGKIEFNICEGIHKYDNHKELIVFKNNTGLEIAVTPEHGMLYRTEHGIVDNTKWKKKNANEIENYDRFSVPSSGEYYTEQDALINDDILKILAWILTEGSIDKSRKNPSIRICQSDDGSGFVDEIENLLLKTKIKYTKSKRYNANSTEHGQYRNYDAYKFYIGTEHSKILLPYLNIENKTLKHDVMMSLSLRQRKMFIEEMCKGDGSKCGTDHYCHYYTNNKDLLDQFQTICVLSGIRAKANIKREDGTWVVSMTKTNTHTVLQTKRINYTGKTWCLTVPNGTLIARRNGIPFITQNTHKMGKVIWKNKLLIEQGCACIPMDYEADAKMMYSQQHFGYAVVYMNRSGEVDFNRTRPIYYGTGTLVDADINISIGE